MVADTRIGSHMPVRAGFARWLQKFRSEWFIPCTGAGADWQQRDVRTAMAHVPGRMVDAADEMLKSWRVNANSPKAGPSGFLPVILVAVAKDMNPLPPEFGRTLLRPMLTQLPGDDRWVKLRTSSGTLRAQLLVVAADIETARDMAAQFLGYTQDVVGTSFTYSVNTGDKMTAWPCQVRAGDAFAMPELQEQYRLNVLRIDLELVPTVPHIDAGPGGLGYPAAGTSVISPGGHPAQVGELPPGVSLVRQEADALAAHAIPGDELLNGFASLMHALNSGAPVGGSS